MTRVAQGDGPEVIHVGLSEVARDGVRTLEVTSDLPGVTVHVEAR
jgi:hypothetical protein